MRRSMVVVGILASVVLAARLTPPVGAQAKTKPAPTKMSQE